MNEHIRTAAVLGAGNMGAQIAAHLANAGLRVHLLDRIPSAPTAEEMAKGLTLEDASVRNRLAKDGLQRQSKARPAAFFLPEFAARIEIGNFEDHLDAIAGADWIIEAVLEDLEVKRALFSRIDRLRRPETLVSSNTSGLSVRAMSEGCSEDFQRHFMGTHFFNPVRYMKLVEIIPTPKTNPSALSLLENFCDLRLGKGVVLAKDTPNFIANRIGTFAALFTLHHMIREGYSIEEVDLLTGPAVGHPKMASFRLADLVGVDVLAHVAKTLYESALDDESKEIFRPPEFLNDMLAKNWLGNKTGGGFYKKIKENGKSVILTLDIPKMEYRHRVKPAFPSVDAALSIENTAERVRRLISSHDRAGAFIWQVTSATLAYAADKITEISDDIVNVDRAMNWGYNWEMGPFRTWDAIGVRAVADRMQKEGREVPSRIEQFLSAGHQSFYQFQAGSRQYFDFQSDSYKNLVDLPGVILLPSLKDRKRTITSNPGATLLDLGDGVACLEFHSKMNAVGNDAIEMMRAALREVGARFEGLVIGNQAENFSVGANIMLLLLEAQEENWEEIDFMIRTFQDTVMSLRYSAKPVVAAPFGMALGGGCEVCLGSDRIRAAAETYMGLVEVGVGLIPGGGGV